MPRRRLLLALGCAVPVGLAASGCAVLTRSQVEAVHEFATEAEDFGTLPGQVIREHRDLRRMAKALDLSANQDPDRAWEKVELAHRFMLRTEQEAARADLALEILDRYTALLAEVTSDRFTEGLNEQAEGLGKALDKSVSEYNEVFGRSIGLVGAPVAALVRAAGGVAIRRRQGLLLRETLTRFDPGLQILLEDVESLLDLYAPESGEEGLIALEMSEIRSLFEQHARAGASGDLPLPVVEAALDATMREEKTRQLAVQCRQAARAYRAAHAALLAEVSRKRDLRQGIAELRALADEVQAARRLKKSLEG